ncbi:MAG: TerC family protein [Ilumatobacteraceae bacterium]|jgi:predicted tellurium resistance membrane protein TerC
MSWISDPAAWSALVALLVLEIVLGVDNVIFISIIAAKLPAEMQDRARRVGLLAAGGMRVLLLLSVGWIISLKEELFAFSLWGWDLGFSGKELILLAGGVFLLYKATKEIHHKLEGVEEAHGAKEVLTFGAVIGQVMLLDLVFSLDSVFTAVGITEYVPVMVIAIVTAVIVMLGASGPIYRFVNQHPSVKMLALAFLLLIGFTLVVEGFGEHIGKGYIYAAMAFSVFVEVLNIGAGSRRKKKVEPVHLRQQIPGPG